MRKKGFEREMSLEKSKYFSDRYFSLQQLCSFAHQIRDIYLINPSKILEVGIGNGFTSTFLKCAGFDITTVDINPELEPDICSPISKLDNFFDTDSFDLIVCCEVLEHIHFNEFESCIKQFRRLGKKLYLTLPDYNSTYGLSGILRLPKSPVIFFKAQIAIHLKKKIAFEHFWEVDSSKITSKKAISNILSNSYQNVTIKRYILNPYHLSFFST
jgi:SAM-dependent methyltransferase